MKTVNTIQQAIVIALLTILSVTFAIAQPTATNRGRDFYCSFLPNYHENSRREDDALRLQDSLFIFIGADIPTSGVIYCTDRDGVTTQFPFQIFNPKQIYSFAITWRGYELEGWNNHGTLATDSINQEGRVAQQHFRITSNDDVTVYALNQAARTSDAFLLLPVEALGTEYRILCYPSDGFTTQNSSPFLDLTSTPSEFGITASENNTQVIINPTAPSFRHGLAADTIVLQQGESYLVQAKISTSNLRPDLTGTKVVSNKPIAVFAGHQRALLPVDLRNIISSRDHLIEQMPPLSSWGKSAILTPYPQPGGLTPYGIDLCRILAAFDSTDVFIGGVKKKTLSAGQFYTDTLLVPTELRSSKPVLVAQYKRTSTGMGGLGTQAISDPFMMIIPPKEQFMLSYRCINAQARNAATNQPVYVQQYIIVVAPQTTVSDITLDDFPVSAAAFQPAIGSEYMVATLKVGDGTHSLRASEPFGIYVFGYGSVNSYGYVGGMSFKEFDYQEPEIFTTPDCFQVRGVAIDTHRTDSRIETVAAPVNLQKNTTITVEPLIPFADSVHFTAKLTDIFEDGECTILAKDSIGFITSKKLFIPGYTLRVSSQLPKGQLPEIATDGPLERSYCFPVTITNYGLYPQIINSSTFASNTGHFSVPTRLPIILAPNSSVEITVCFFADHFGVYIDTLSIGNDCVSKQITSIVVTAIPDKMPPVISITNSPCPVPVGLTVSESLPSDLGIKSLIFIDSLTKNVTVTTSKGEGYQTLNMVIIPTNVDEDAFFAFNVTDSAGNISTIRDTIPGFTLSLNMPNAPNYQLDFGETVLGVLNCREVELENYGQFTLDFGNPGLSQNRIFSIPPSEQSPLIIQPNQKRTINMCYAPIKVNDIDVIETDTLFFHFGCLTKTLHLQGIAKPSVQSTISECDVPIKIISLELPESYGSSANYLGQNIPNPASNTTTVSFMFTEQTKASIMLYDAIGNPVETLASGEFPRGVYELTADLSKYANGVYYYQLQTSKERITHMISVMH
ncbi:MAG: T9SS type A sorting domain-containing protein [Ignavibacteriae bacterium]|nr:T9SS type A sorting domain-containing protein [Ignavibacteriota bacterium]